MTTGMVIATVAASVDGFAAGPGDGPGQPLGLGGERLFTWFEDQVPPTIVPYAFVTDGIASAVRQALATAAGQDVRLMGASVIQRRISGRLLHQEQMAGPVVGTGL